jgi:hypothetical protein
VEEGGNFTIGIFNLRQLLNIPVERASRLLEYGV